MKDFFISYNKADRAWAEWIAWHLDEAGFTTVLQAWDFRPGSNFVVDMDRATVETERTIAVLSPDYPRASFTQPEWAVAFAKDPTGEKGLLLPVRVSSHGGDLAQQSRPCAGIARRLYRSESSLRTRRANLSRIPGRRASAYQNG
jgi:hypothetical protein